MGLVSNFLEDRLGSIMLLQEQAKSIFIAEELSRIARYLQIIVGRIKKDKLSGGDILGLNTIYREFRNNILRENVKINSNNISLLNNYLQNIRSKARLLLDKPKLEEVYKKNIITDCRKAIILIDIIRQDMI